MAQPHEHAGPYDFQTIVNLQNLDNYLDQRNYEHLITGIRKEAQEAFRNFNTGIEQVDHVQPSVFDYIDRFVQLHGEINTIRADIDNYQNYPPVDLLPEIYQADARLLYERFRRIERLRNNLGEYLLQGGFAEDHQIMGPQPGFDNTVPRRFRYVEQGELENYLIAAEMVGENLTQVDQWLKQIELQNRFGTVAARAHEAWHQFQQGQGVPTSFGYIDEFRKENEKFEDVEYLIEAGVELLSRIEIEHPNLMIGPEKQQVQEFRQRLRDLRNTRENTRNELIQQEWATDDQLTFGYDGNLPPAFQQQPQGPGLGRGHGQAQ